MRHWLGFILLFGTLGVAIPVSASPVDDAFHAYQAAMAAGNVAEADQQANKAWQLAEEADDPKNAGLLAFYLAKLRARYEPGMDALTPARRAVELAGQTDGALPEQQAALLLAALNVRQDPGDANMAALKSAYAAYEAAELPPGLASYMAEEKLLADYSQAGNWYKASDIGEAMLKSYDAIGASDGSLLASIHIATGVAYMRQRRDESFPPAYDHFQAAVEASKNDRNAVFAQGLAWGNVARALMDIAGIRTHRIPKKSYRDIYYEDIGPTDCPAVEWSKQPNPVFPGIARARGYVGSTILIYDIKPDGTLDNVRIGAEVPEKKFGEASLRAMDKAQVKNAADLSETCRTNQVLSISFTLNTRKSKGFSRLKKRHLGGIPTKDTD